MTLNDEMIARLKKAAARVCWDETEDGEPNDDFNPMERSGGNFDDAYHGGTDDGHTYLAREILTSMGITWL